ncbi:serine hydrolase domain-containing protein [Mongoliitalea lutea]|uniref:Beta-lactamase-related domain-containing protein n=1 Tax=Mongoliitalea lutea TaxID=849756 RepID=A0A8J3CX52_9BACT|nr:serine hydrolase domain-containing protein [Mongoliitalea lutea]GHB32252.1 hypothetical protein GCM10008106_11540 [Mongoliitalea lutea]
MKRSLLFIAATILFVLGGFISYNHFSWKKLPNFESSGFEEIFDEIYTKQGKESSKTLRELVSTLKVPSASAAVAVNGQLVWVGTYGFADIEKQTKVSPLTLYRIGSTSKALTSVAVMKLVQDEKLDLDVPISTIIQNYPEKQWSFSTRHLLSHTAGLPDYEDLGIKGLYYSMLNFKQFSSVEESLALFQNIPLLFEPGTGFKYNSFGPVLASRVVEISSGMSFEEFMNKYIFQPSGMKNTYLEKGKNNPASIAKFYETDNQGSYRNWHTFGFPKQIQNLSYKWAGGGMLSTPTDLVLLGNRLLTDNEFIGEDIKGIFFTPQLLNNGEVNIQNYALGWRLNQSYTSKHFKNRTVTMMVHHAGISKGSMNFLCLFPKENIVINVSTNGRSEDIDFSHFWDFTMQLVAPFVDGLHSEGM